MPRSTRPARHKPTAAEAPPSPQISPEPAATVMVIQMVDGSQHRVERVTAMAWTKEALIIEASQGRIYYPMSRVQCTYEPHPEMPLQAVIERMA